MLAALDLAFVVSYRRAVARFVRDTAWTSPSRVPPFDAAVVFFGALQAPGQLDDATQRRVADAADLFRHRRVRQVIAVGGARASGRPTGAEIMVRSLATLGVSADSVRYDSVSYDSFSNWAEAERIARLEHLHALVLVSSASHLMRLARVIRGSDLRVAYYVGEDDALRASTSWWTVHRESLAYVALWLLPSTSYAGLIRRLRHAA